MFLDWRPAAQIAAGLLCGAAVLRVAGDRLGRWAVNAFGVVRELGLMFGLYALWVYAGRISIMKTDKALSRAHSLWHVERVLHLPSEVHLQALTLPHPVVVQAANLYYATVHGVALIVFLTWVFFWHRDAYPRIRNVVALVTGTSLAIQLIPVAPPRMLHDLGFVDTALRYHQSVYPALGQGMSDQLSAMPSVHVAWAVLIGVAVVLVGRRRRRWAALAHPAVTVLVVVVTANHWWLDGVVAVALLALSVAVDAACRAAWAWARRRLPVPAGVPVVEPALTSVRADG